MTSLRRAARALVVAPGPQVLLVQFTFGRLRFWAPPGGGLEPGEDAAAALRRELAEEVGLTDFEAGPVVYTHERAYVGRRGGQHDVVFRVDVPEPFEPRPALSHEQLLAEHVTDLRWFDLDALRALPTLPFDLAALVADLERGPQHLDDTRVPPVLVVVSGPAAAGKTTLARALGDARRLPVFGRDDVKEPMFDRLGFPDLPTHRRMGALTHDPLDVVVERLLGSGQSLIVEAPFERALTSPVLQELRRRLRFQIARLQLHAEGEVPLRLDPIDVDGPLLHLDTTHDLDVDAALSFVDQVLPPRR